VNVTAVSRSVIFLPICAFLAFAQTPGLRNFHQVNEHIYRGAQPAVWGYKTLKSLGVRTVIDLRGDGIAEELEKNLVKKNGMEFISIPLDGHKAPLEWQMDDILKLLEDQSKWPIYIHCRRGADRTGTVMACYRIAHDHWDNKRALDEAKTYDMDPGEKLMQAFILQFKPHPQP
jgi:protein tyrosine/serine phosphatase